MIRRFGPFAGFQGNVTAQEKCPLQRSGDITANHSSYSNELPRTPKANCEALGSLSPLHR
jgi:hypothetical protein